MPSPLNIISEKAHKLQLSEAEKAALVEVKNRERRFLVIGAGAGGCLGFLVSRGIKNKFIRGVSMLFTSSFIGAIATNYATLSGIKALSNRQKYPQIAASLQEISEEFMRSHGIDPANPQLGRVGPRRADFKQSPQASRGNAQQPAPEAKYDDFGSSDSEHRAGQQNEFGNPALSQAREQQHEFGNPALGQPNEQKLEFGNPALGQPNEQKLEFGNPALGQPNEQQLEFGNPALDKTHDFMHDEGGNARTPQQTSSGNNSWNNVRMNAGTNENAWDKLRSQGGQSANVWGSQSVGESGFSTEDSGFGTSSFPGSRDDSQDDWKRESGSSGTAFAT
ncbi:hypothetical protein J3F82_000201 [Coemansia sp. RSA 637]|nr:hypothetical protein J3F82_000201 [Coemansia sp. RSA 637]